METNRNSTKGRHCNPDQCRTGKVGNWHTQDLRSHKEAGTDPNCEYSLWYLVHANGDFVQAPFTLDYVYRFWNVSEVYLWTVVP